MSRARDLADRVLHNRTHEDTEGGRESNLTFKGEQSGGEISTLAQIQASHDGTSDDVCETVTAACAAIGGIGDTLGAACNADARCSYNDGVIHCAKFFQLSYGCSY